MAGSRALDALVAEKIMGWTDMQPNTTGRGGSIGRRPCPPQYPYPELWGSFDLDETDYYTSDPAADYSVLEHVRANWLDKQQQSWGWILWDMWGPRMYRAMDTGNHGGLPQMFYQPGDYSRAALAALGVQTEE